MINTKYIKRTFSKGSYIVKALKLMLFIKHNVFSFLNIRIGDYPSPPSEIGDIAHFNKSKRIHTKDEYKKYFKTENLYKDGDFVKMKPGLILISFHKEKLYIKKCFKGVYKVNRFYSELICLHRLRNKCNVPKIEFVDYKNKIIYLEYIYGKEICDKRSTNRYKLNRQNIGISKENILSIMKQIHKNKILKYDIQPANYIVNGDSYYVIDFADSLYFGKGLKISMNSIQRRELERVDNLLSSLVN